MALLGIRQAAEQLGITHPTLLRRIKAGKITRDANGKVDVDKARAEWDSKKDSLQQQRRSRKHFDAESATKSPKGAPADSEPAKTALGQLPQLQTAREAVRLKKEQLLLKKIEGSLLDRSDVDRAWSSMIAAARTRLLMIGDELGDKLASESDPIRCRELVEARVRAALSELAHA